MISNTSHAKEECLRACPFQIPYNRLMGWGESLHYTIDANDSYATRVRSQWWCYLLWHHNRQGSWGEWVWLQAATLSFIYKEPEQGDASPPSKLCTKYYNPRGSENHALNGKGTSSTTFSGIPFLGTAIKATQSSKGKLCWLMEH